MQTSTVGRCHLVGVIAAVIENTQLDTSKPGEIENITICKAHVLMFGFGRSIISR